MSKYDSKFDEPINPGHDYKFLVQRKDMQIFEKAIVVKEKKTVCRKKSPSWIEKWIEEKTTP